MAPSKRKERLTEALILDLQVHPSLWNKRCKDYKDSGMRSNAWFDILSNMKSSFDNNLLSNNNLGTVEGIKSHWKNLRTTYKRKKREAEGKSGAGLDMVLSKKEWPFLNMLRFLDESDRYLDGVQGSSSFIDRSPANSVSGDEDGRRSPTTSQRSRTPSFSDTDDGENQIKASEGKC